MRSAGCYGFRIVLPVVLVVFAACSGGDDARTEKIVPGISRDSAMAILHSPLEGGPPVAAPDSTTNIWWAAQYLMKGKMIEIIWYSAANEHRTRADTVPAKRVVPIVVVDGKVVGVGREAFDKAVAEYSLQQRKY